MMIEMERLAALTTVRSTAKRNNCCLMKPRLRVELGISSKSRKASVSLRMLEGFADMLKEGGIMNQMVFLAMDSTTKVMYATLVEPPESVTEYLAGGCCK